jgi:hypothetical protein
VPDDELDDTPLVRRVQRKSKVAKVNSPASITGRSQPVAELKSKGILLSLSIMSAVDEMKA